MNGKRVIVTAAAALAAVAIALGLWLLWESRADITGQTVLGDGALDMVLIDIEDQDAASHYHVNTLGVYVLAVAQGSEAYEAGVRSGDRIVSANGQPGDIHRGVWSAARATGTVRRAGNGAGTRPGRGKPDGDADGRRTDAGGLSGRRKRGG